MKLWIMKLGPLAPGILALLLGASAAARAEVWQPAPGHTQIAIWPGTPPDVQPLPGRETETLRTDRLIAGKPWMAATDVNRPTMTIYAPTGNNTGAAVVVFPGGGFQVLAMDLEGTEACRWLTSLGITCVLLKYRVPSEPFNWRCKCYDHGAFALSLPALEDAQRAIRLVRYHAAQWHVDPHGIGVLGFSAGGYLVAEVSTRSKRPSYAPIDAADKESSRPDFALAIYPGHLATDADRLNPNVQVTRDTPPTFLVQAEDDDEDGVNQSLVYYMALAKAHVPAEMHLYARGGHAFGLRPTSEPITSWPALADAWLHLIGVLPKR